MKAVATGISMGFRQVGTMGVQWAERTVAEKVGAKAVPWGG